MARYSMTRRTMRGDTMTRENEITDAIKHDPKMMDTMLWLRFRLFAGFTVAAWASLLGTHSVQRTVLAFMAEHFSAFYGRGDGDAR